MVREKGEAHVVKAALLFASHKLSCPIALAKAPRYTNNILAGAIMFKIIFCLIAFCSFLGAADADMTKVKSAGSVLLVKKDGEFALLLGRRNKSERPESGTWGSFHGNIIKRGEINDATALEASKRNLVWEIIGLEGDPKLYPSGHC